MKANIVKNEGAQDSVPAINIDRNIVALAAIDKYLETNIVLPTEKEIKQAGYEMIEWGPANMYPFYLLDLYRNSATLHSVINGCVDYLCGDGVSLTDTAKSIGFSQINALETPRDFFNHLGLDLFLYGGCSYQVVRNKEGRPAAFYWVDMRYLRTNKESDVFFYSEDFGKKYSRTAKTIVYPKFFPEAVDVPDSIVYIRPTHMQVYPEPLYAAAVKACEMERGTDDYHLNALGNGFSSSYAINFTNGVPTDQVKEEIEKDVIEKTTGPKNAGRVLLTFSPDMTHRPIFEKMTIDDFGEKYKSLEKSAKQKIFTAFRANPNLFGIPTENLGFSSEEYESAFKLFNRTVIRPAQDRLKESIDRTLGVSGAIEILPFTL